MKLQSPYPFFGGKSKVSSLIWKRFGKVQGYIEPFFGSGAVLLGRPLPFDGVETVNDIDGMISNFWRAVKADPDAVAKFADWPVFENDANSRHVWLVNRKDSLQAKLEGDPDYFDAKVAGWWCWSMACWIGSGFCSGNGPWQVVEAEDGTRTLENVGNAGCGVKRPLIHLGPGRGVSRQRVHLSDAGQGVNRKRVHLGDEGCDVGNSGCGERGILAWMQALSERLRRVRVCCGDWTRVCGGKSGNALKQFFVGGNRCAVFLDPPYSTEANRDEGLYAHDDLQVAHAVRDWCIEHGNDRRLKICLAGYEGEHDMPGWNCVKGKAGSGHGYGALSKEVYANKDRERLWFSPHCCKREGFF